jgi:hypothetical protein
MMIRLNGTPRSQSRMSSMGLSPSYLDGAPTALRVR